MSDHVFRILDANANRIREALRVIEDYLRFTQGDPRAVEICKQLRHDFRTLVPPEWEPKLLAARGTEHDVGRTIKTSAEQQRPDDLAVIRAAFGRLTEAARSFSEFAKQFANGADAAERVEQLRYTAYELEQRLVLRGTPIERFRQHSLYVILTADLCRFAWSKTLEMLLSCDVGILQIREKGIDDHLLRQRAEHARAATSEADCLLIINDRPDIARLVRADGVHVGQEDLSVADVRQVAGGDMLVGKSTHDLFQFSAALQEQPDYLAVGPIYPTETKPQDHIAGLETLRKVRTASDIPIVAIGGITPERAGEVQAAGASQICVCSAVISAEKPGAAVQAFQSVL